MPNLASFQEQFRKAVHTQKLTPELTMEITPGPLGAEARMQVYQNNYELSLSGVIENIFPLVAAFVGAPFLRAAAKHYLTQFPPKDSCLHTFGADFSTFLATYKHTAEVTYVADIAALEWAVHEMQHAKALSEGASAEHSSMRGVLLNPNVHIIVSEYPLLQLWMVGRGQLMPEAVNITSGAQSIAVVLEGLEVKLNAITPNECVALEWLYGETKERPENFSEALKTLERKSIIVCSEVKGGKACL